MRTPKSIHVTTLIACSISLALGIVVAIEDAEVWGQLQWFGYSFTCAALGAIMQRSVHRLCSDEE